MSLYSIIRHLGIGEPKALGLDTSVVVVERVPLITSKRQPDKRRRIRRVIPEETKNMEG